MIWPHHFWFKWEGWRTDHNLPKLIFSLLLTASGSLPRPAATPSSSAGSVWPDQRLAGIPPSRPSRASTKSASQSSTASWVSKRFWRDRRIGRYCNYYIKFVLKCSSLLYKNNANKTNSNRFWNAKKNRKFKKDLYPILSHKRWEMFPTQKSRLFCDIITFIEQLKRNSLMSHSHQGIYCIFLTRIVSTGPSYFWKILTTN